MPEERNRIAVDRPRRAPPAARTSARPRSLRGEGVAGRIEVVGDVMADAVRSFAPIARERSHDPRAARARGRGRTSSRRSTARRTCGRTGSRGSSTAWADSTSPSSSRRTRARGAAARATARPERPARRAARLPRHGRARLAGARDRDRLRRAPEGGVLVRRPLRDRAALDRVGRHRRGRGERARRRRPRAARRRPSPMRGCPPSGRSSTATATRRSASPSLYAAKVPRWYERMTSRSSAPATSASRSRTTFAEAGCHVLVVDVVPAVVEALNRGESHIEDVDERAPRAARRAGADPRDDRLRRPEGGGRDPDRAADAALEASASPTSRSSRRAARGIAAVLRDGQIVVLESTTWPGTTREVLQPILEAGSGLKLGEGFYLAMSPERVDPGREDWTTKTTPKVLGGDHARVHEARGRRSTAAPSTPSSRSRRPRPRS